MYPYAIQNFYKNKLLIKSSSRLVKVRLMFKVLFTTVTKKNGPHLFTYGSLN